jgi:hypothetical protein
MTRDACRDIGWDYRIFTGLASVERHNLEWLAAYRQPRHQPTPLEAGRILRAVNEPRTLSNVCSTLTPEPARTIHHIYNLIWRQVLRTDMSQPLSWDSMIERTFPHA